MATFNNQYKYFILNRLSSSCIRNAFVKELKATSNKLLEISFFLLGQVKKEKRRRIEKKEDEREKKRGL